ncbi:MAG: hypothetical protein WEA09_06550 [Gemmatimonadota bacterium]
MRLSSGEFVVVDGGLSSRINVFAADARHLRAIGRAGDGPGEFRWITSAQATPEDSILLYDASAQRLTVALQDGRWVRTASFRPGQAGMGGDGLEAVARLGDGALVGLSAQSMARGQAAQLVRDTVAVALLDPDLNVVEVLKRLPARMTSTTLLGGRPVFRVPAFSPEAIYTTWGSCVFLSTGETNMIWVYSSSGELVGSIRGPGEPRVVEEEHLRIRLAHDLEVYPRGEPAILERLLFEEARPDYLPFYHRIIADDWGHLWLQEYSPPLGAGTRWDIVSQGGQHLATVETPAPMSLFAVYEDGVLGRRFGDLRVEMVEMLPFRNQLRQMAPPLTRRSESGS